MVKERQIKVDKEKKSLIVWVSTKHVPLLEKYLTSKIY
jgi:hypothetical protein